MKYFSISLIFLHATGALFASTPTTNHVAVVVLENRNYGDVIGSPAMPYLNSLAAKSGLLTNYYGNAHPSLPNYFMMTTGQKLVTSDSNPGTVTANNIVRELITVGKTWKAYVESLPYAGYVGDDVYPYVRHHVPMT